MKHFYTLTLAMLSLSVSAQPQAENPGAAPPPPDAEMNVAAEIRVMKNDISHLKEGQKRLEGGQKELNRKLELILKEKVGWTPFGFFLLLFVSAFGGMGAFFYFFFNRLMNDFSAKLSVSIQK